MPDNASDRYRVDYAKQIARLANVRDPRIERAFASIYRESFLPPPPWTVISMGAAIQTSQLADLYDNVLVAIDRPRGINNGEPALHAAWLDAISPQPGDVAIHVGAGMGYYTAILALLVEPGGHVEAYEYETDLATAAARNLEGFSNVAVHAGSAFGVVLPSADVIYVNAGVQAPDPEWLRALNPAGRLIFPWQPRKGWGPAILVTRRAQGFSAKPIMNVGFITCSGATERSPASRPPTEGDLGAVRSVWLKADHAPDKSAIAVYDNVWFSQDEVRQ